MRRLQPRTRAWWRRRRRLISAPVNGIATVAISISDRPRGEWRFATDKITPFSLTFVVATVYKDASWLDGNETIVIDYSKTSFFASKIRDEIREVEPGVYLGKVWWGKPRILDFALSNKTH